MAVRTFRIKDVKVSGQNFLDSDEVDQAVASGATGWTLGKTASGVSAEQNALVERATTALTSDTTFPKPLAPDNTLGNGWLMADGASPFTGDFAAGNWSLTGVLRAVTAGGAGGSLKYRVYAVANSSGGSPRELTTSIQVGTSVAIQTTADVTSGVTWAAPAITLSAEYIIVTVAFLITVGGGGNTVDALLRHGTSANGTRIVTTNWTAGAAATTSELTALAQRRTPQRRTLQRM